MWKNQGSWNFSHAKLIPNSSMIIAARAFNVPDPNFGNVIHTEIECTPKATLTEVTLRNWLRPQLSRAEMPHSIRFKTIEMLSTGKQKRR